jgi:perosamine synthetase
VERRREIAARYDAAFADVDVVEPIGMREDSTCAYHLYVIRLNLDMLSVGREEIFDALHAEGIGMNVHYIPVHYHPFYRENFGTEEGLCPVAEQAYERILTLPVFPRMGEEDISDVIRAVAKVLSACGA